MKESSIHLYEFILRQCAGVDPNPWYPSTYVPENGVSRADLDQGLDDLRLGGLIRLTDWVQGRGQGYALTSEGSQVASSPAVLAKLREWKPAQPLSDAEADRRRDRRTTLERGDAVRAAFTHYSTPWVTCILVLANILVFAAGLCLTVIQRADLNGFISHGGSGLILYETGAYNGMALVMGQWWRLITTCFVHAGLLHIGMNMLALYSFGRLAERMFGGPALLLVYLVSGLGGSVTSAIVGPETVSVGASGAICGIVAAEISWLVLNRGHLPPEFFAQMLRSFRNSVILVILISLVPGISWQAHLGGAVAGLFTGAALTVLRYGGGLQRVLGGVGVLAVMGAVVGALLVSQAVDPRWQELFARRDRWNLMHRVDVLLNDARTLCTTDVEPAIQQGGLGGDAESVRASIASARTKFQEALTLLENAGPFQEERFERAIKQECAFIRQEMDDMEIEEFLNFDYPREKEIIQAALNVFENGKSIDFKAQQPILAEARRRAEEESSFHARIVTKTQENYIALLDALAEYSNLASAGFEGPKSWPSKQMTELDLQVQYRVKAFHKCEDSLRGALRHSER